MNYSVDNPRVYELIRQNLNVIVPFVGAGLSAFAYPVWKKFLVSVSEKLYDSKKKEELKKLLKENKYEEAASFLELNRTKVNFIDDLELAFSTKKLEDISLSELEKQAVYLLPLLFKGLVVTTNFEQILENVYNKQQTTFSATGHPGHKEMLTKALRSKDKTTLYKFHGDISEPGHLILTKESYDNNYILDSELVKELTKCFEHKIMLFLGCSLNKDRTMSILKQTLADGVMNYAIVDCNKKNREARVRELGENGIRAILYPSGKHEAVRIILEKLLQETDNQTFQRLNYYESITKPKNSNLFVYTSGAVDFFGREKELKALMDFCTFGTDTDIKWWAITGAGGSGKSRLVYEFGKKLREKNWNVITPYPLEFKSLKEISDSLNKNTLFIIDYVQAYSKIIGQWLIYLCKQKYNIKNRIILIEREGKNIKDATWVEQMKYGDILYSQSIIDSGPINEFIELKPLDTEYMTKIIGDFAKNYHRYLTESEIQQISAKLKEIDSKLCRPLYALILVDAYFENKKAFSRWSRDEIFDDVIKREITHYEAYMRGAVSTDDKKLNNAYLSLKLMATICNGLAITEDAEDLCPYDWKIITEKTSDYKIFEGEEDMLLRAGLISKRENSEYYAIPPMQPDLLGEYFVISQLMEMKKSEKIHELLSNAWKSPDEAFNFFSMMFIDYYDILKINKNLLIMLLEPANESKDNINKLVFAMFLVNATSVAEGEICEVVITRLRGLTKQNPENAEVIGLFAKGLFNLTTKQDEAGIRETLAELRGLAKQNPENAEVIGEFAKVLFNLTVEQDEEGIKETLTELRDLAKQNPENTEVIGELAKELFNLTAKQDEAGIRETLTELRGLAKQNPENAEVIGALAEGLFNLTVEQDEAGRKETLTELRDLAKQNPENSEVIGEFAEGLFNLMVKQDEAGIKETLTELRDLAKQNPENTEVIGVLAKGLFNLTVEQDEAGRKETLTELRDLAKQNPENTEVIGEYAKGLVNLTSKQDEAGIRETLTELRGLAKQIPENAEVIGEYAKGLVNLTVEQDEEGIKETLTELRDLAKQNPENTEVIGALAKGLFNLTSIQDEVGIKEMVTELRDLAKQNPENAEVIGEYAKGLVNLTVKQDEAGRKETVEELCKLIEQHFNNPYIKELLDELE